MTKGAQLWPGEKMIAFFRAHIRRETSLGEAEVERLASALNRAVNRMLVWDGDAPNSDVVLQPDQRAQNAAPFNPFAFSTLIILARGGTEALAKRLSEIRSAENLRAIAEAQHLAVDPSLKRPEELRRAILSATEQRLADRKAAAS
jgi:hypothetical protein